MAFIALLAILIGLAIRYLILASLFYLITLLFGVSVPFIVLLGVVFLLDLILYLFRGGK